MVCPIGGRQLFAVIIPLDGSTKSCSHRSALLPRTQGDLAPQRRTVPELDWQRQAACRHCQPDLFFPAGNTAPAVVADIEAAKAICATCLVQPECLRYALQTRQEFGIWGGTTEDERRGLLKAMRWVGKPTHTASNRSGLPVP
jgi:WhiB family redox-sensing transcriptional regulator